MNIFFLDTDPRIAAQLMCDQHVNKMILESTQMLNSALDPHDRYYRTTHYNHPSSVWVRQSSQHAEWLLNHAFLLCERYTASTSKIHACVDKLQLFDDLYVGIDNGFTEPPQCMPDQYKQSDTVAAYTAYYDAKLHDWHTRTDKRQINATWNTSCAIA